MMSHNRLAGLAAASVCLLSGPLAAQPPTNETPADWKRRPSGESVAERYPAIAQVIGVPGHVVLVCTVDTDGRAHPCAVAREAPTGLGFGRAALELAETFEFHPAFADGVSKRSEVRLPITFSLPKAESALPPLPAVNPVNRKLVASVVEAWSREDFTQWMFGQTFDAMALDSKVDEPIRTGAINRLFTSGAAHEPRLRAATVDAYSAYLPKRTIDALVTWSKGDQALPSPEFGDAATEKIVRRLEPIVRDINADARKSLCDLVGCGEPAPPSAPKR